MADSSGGLGGAIVGIFGTLIGLATIAVMVSQRAQTGSILTALGGAAGTAIGAAVAPVTAGASSVVAPTVNPLTGK
jgi:hypothetical protein